MWRRPDRFWKRITRTWRCWNCALAPATCFDLIKGWKGRYPKLRVLILSAFDEALYAERALRAGAVGYVMKEEPPQETLSAIRAVLAGEMFLSRKMASCLLHKLIQAKPPVRDGQVEGLSDRELQVFRMLGTGLGSRRIGDELHLSIKTIETYRENIKHKLGLRNASESHPARYPMGANLGAT